MPIWPPLSTYQMITSSYFRTFLLLFLLLPMASFGQLFESAGNLSSVQKEKDGLSISFPNGKVRVTVYSATVFRIHFSKTALFDDLSYAVVANPMETKFEFADGATAVLKTDSARLEIVKNPLRFRLLDAKGRVLNEDEPAFGTGWNGEQVTSYKKMQNGERFVGFGEKTGPLNRRGEGYTNWNTDFYAYPSGADPIYQSLPFYIGQHGDVVYGLFLDNTYRSHFNFGASNDRFSSFTAEGGEMNYYLFAHSNVAKILESYTWLTGRMPMPPKWGLGLQQCRYSYYPDKEVLNIARTFRDKGIPADAMVLDIHYMDKYKLFTWDKERFPNPKGMNDQLKSMGFHTVTIIDPGVKVEKGYPAYEDGLKENIFLKYPDGTNYTGQVWPGWCHFPDFTMPKARDWWGGKFKDLVASGVEGFWNDMNEPATWGQRFPDLVEFNWEGKRTSHRKGHNVYGLQMVKASYEGTRKLLGNKRPFILTRAGFSGIQRYAAVWTGDNVSSDDHMMAGVRLLNSMGLTGVPYTGMDVGGFTGGPSKELFGRWVSIGAFSPFFRIHSGVDSKESDPWSYGEKIEAINKNYISLRYRMLPYLYSVFAEAHRTGLPVNRSLAIQHTTNAMVYDGRFQNQYYFGPSVMVCPVESTKDITKVLLPDADGWYSLYNDQFYAGGKDEMVDCPIEKLPVFVKGGAVLAMQSQVNHTGEKPSDTLTVHVYQGKKAVPFSYYEDDGESYQYETGTFYQRSIQLEPGKRQVSFGKAEGSYASRFSKVKLVFHGFSDLKTPGLVAEQYSFVSALPHFDPVGNPAAAPACAVKSIVMNFGSEAFQVKY